MDAIMCKFERERLEQNLESEARQKKNLENELAYCRGQISALQRKIAEIEYKLEGKNEAKQRA